jgi:hypothetical protein
MYRCPELVQQYLGRRRVVFFDRLLAELANFIFRSASKHCMDEAQRLL